MGLRGTIDTFSTRRITRLELPTLNALKTACGKYEGLAKSAEDDTVRVRRIVSAFTSKNAHFLGHGDVRFITAAIGSTGIVSPALVNDILAEVDRRRFGPLLRAVFRALLTNYRDLGLRELLRGFLKQRLSEISGDIRRFAERSGILHSDDRLKLLARRLCGTADIQFACISTEITASVLASGYGIELKLAVVRNAVRTIGSDALERILRWSLTGATGTPIADYYEAMLEPFLGDAPSPNIQKILMSVLLDKFRDPRIHEWPRLSGNRAVARREACVTTVTRWLSIEYLSLFIGIIEETADKQFKPRKTFWLKYFEMGYVTDLTLVLASDADQTAKRMRRDRQNTEYMQWSALSSALPNQSVLLMRMGDLIIAEWSHSGAMRFWKSEHRGAPTFHLPLYTGSQLREGSLRVKVKNSFRSSIIHHENGQWMQWARDAIEHHTGLTA